MRDDVMIIIDVMQRGMSIKGSYRSLISPVCNLSIISCLIYLFYLIYDSIHVHSCPHYPPLYHPFDPRLIIEEQSNLPLFSDPIPVIKPSYIQGGKIFLFLTFLESPFVLLKILSMIIHIVDEWYIHSQLFHQQILIIHRSSL